MAKFVDIMEAKKGVIYKYVINTVRGNYALRSEQGKASYVSMLLENENQDICLIAYCILNTQIHIIVKGINKKTLNNYIKTVNRNFYSNDGQSGFPFRPVIDSAKISNKKLTKKINEVHQFAPNGDMASYPYCSYGYLTAGMTDAVTIIKNAQDDENMTLEEFEKAMREKVKIKQNAMFLDEPYPIVLEQVRNRYISNSGNTSESNIIFAIAELCDRTKLSYKRVAAKMGIGRKRRDMLIGVICDMVIRRKYTIDTVIAKLKLKKEYKTGLILEVIAELNRVYNYSYDYILTLIGLDDADYNLLSVLVKGINKQFNEEFETICVRFHLKRDLIPLRAKCGL